MKLDQSPASDDVAKPVAVANSGISTELEPSESNDLNKPKRRTGLWVLAGLGIITIGIGSLITTGTIHLSKFTSTPYTDGQGDKFTLQFYRHTTMKTAAEMPPLANDDPLTGPDFLVGPTGADYPLSIQIRKESAASLYSNTGMCIQAAITLKNPAAGQSHRVCHLSPLNLRQIIYYYEYNDGGVSYLVTMMPYYDYAAATSNTQTAADVNNNVDLTKYNDDLQTILSSINIVH